MFILGLIVGAGLFGLVEAVLSINAQRMQFRADERAERSS